VAFTRGNVNAADYLDGISDSCVLSSITALELIAGTRNQREVIDLDALISTYEQIPPNENIARRGVCSHGDLRALPRAPRTQRSDRRHRDRS
jgi:predicted nucleic acid-binding protein